MRPTMIATLVTLAPAAFSLSGTAAQADSAYISQPTGTVPANPLSPAGFSAPASSAGLAFSSAVPALPETSLRAASTGNFAGTLQVGSYNQVLQVQAGRNDISNVGVIGGRNNVGVIQAGSNLRSNLMLVGMQGSNVAVLQPAGSAPVNALIARLPNGTLLIKR